VKVRLGVYPVDTVTSTNPLLKPHVVPVIDVETVNGLELLIVYAFVKMQDDVVLVIVKLYVSGIKLEISYE
jgi:hypothetical protein